MEQGGLGLGWGGYSSSQQMLSKWPQEGSRDKCSSLQRRTQPSGPVTSRNQLHVFDCTAGDQLIPTGFTYSQVPFTSSLPQLKADTLWQPLLYQRRGDTEIKYMIQKCLSRLPLERLSINADSARAKMPIIVFKQLFTIPTCKDDWLADWGHSQVGFCLHHEAG